MHLSLWTRTTPQVLRDEVLCHSSPPTPLSASLCPSWYKQLVTQKEQNASSLKVNGKSGCLALAPGQWWVKDVEFIIPLSQAPQHLLGEQARRKLKKQDQGRIFKASWLLLWQSCVFREYQSKAGCKVDRGSVTLCIIHWKIPFRLLRSPILSNYSDGNLQTAWFQYLWGSLDSNDF